MIFRLRDITRSKSIVGSPATMPAADARRTPSATSAERNSVLRRLSRLFGLSIAGQALIFLALSWSYRLLAQWILEAVARAMAGKLTAAAEIVAALCVVALELFTALAIGFFAARRLTRS